MSSASSPFSPTTTRFTPATLPTNPRKQECIACIDVEVDGISPSKSSLRQIGLVLIEKSKFGYSYKPDVYTVFKRRWNIKPQKGKEEVPATMEWFRTKAPLVLEEIQTKGEDIEIVIKDFATVWGYLNSQYFITNIVASPACVDFMWIRVLYSQFADPGSYDIPYKWVCLSSQMELVSDLTGYSTSQLLNMFNPLKLRHSHFADEDALVQAVIFLNMKDYVRSIACK